MSNIVWCVKMMVVVEMKYLKMTLKDSEIIGRKMFLFN